MSRRTETDCGSCGAALNDDRYLCADCGHTAREALHAYSHREQTSSGRAPNLLDELSTTATRQNRTAPADDGARPTDRPMPFAPYAAQVLADDTRHLIRSAKLYGAPALLWRTHNAPACARWLSTHLDQVAGRPDAGRFALDIAARYARAVQAIDRPADTWYAGRCTTCDADLYALDGATRIDCTTCTTSHDVNAQRELLLNAVGDTLATATEICRAVHLLDRAVTRSQIDNWVARSQLIRRGRNTDGHHTYRVGDVLDLVART
jgi:predicted RNA-binding Zn-ribbon protein involved in translation (DUF1610 family)